MCRNRSALCCALAATAALLASPPLSAQQYPTKPVKIVVPFVPGGLADVIGRFMAQRLTTALGQQFVVENRPGAGGMIGTEAGVKSPPDGYTLAMIGGFYSIAPSLHKFRFDPVGDITPIIEIHQSPLLVVVHPSVPVRTTRNLIALAKANPGKLNFASGGQGSTPHVAAELFASRAGIKMNHVPYKGGGQAIINMVAGQTDLNFSQIAVALPHVKAGKLRAIAVTSSRRNAAAPDVPTVSESALPGYEVVNWQGLIGPKGLPRPIVDRVNGEVMAWLKLPETGERLQAAGSSPVGGTPEQFLARIKKEIEVWQKVVREAGVKPE
ncbi:MAG: Bug family tripartite tricarboxylate transporter substrate binding protein [Burkholderiales bacterium]